MLQPERQEAFFGPSCYRPLDGVEYMQQCLTCCYIMLDNLENHQCNHRNMQACRGTILTSTL
jgi:hypothetical protein